MEAKNKLSDYMLATSGCILCTLITIISVGFIKQFLQFATSICSIAVRHINLYLSITPPYQP